MQAISKRSLDTSEGVAEMVAIITPTDRSRISRVADIPRPQFRSAARRQPLSPHWGWMSAPCLTGNSARDSSMKPCINTPAAMSVPSCAASSKVRKLKCRLSYGGSKVEAGIARRTSNASMRPSGRVGRAWFGAAAVWCARRAPRAPASMWWGQSTTSARTIKVCGLRSRSGSPDDGIGCHAPLWRRESRITAGRFKNS